MRKEDVDPFLLETVSDGHLQRSERRSVGAWLAEAGLDSKDGRAFVRHRAFELAASRAQSEGESALQWLEGIVKALDPQEAKAPRTQFDATVHFSPGETCLRELSREMDACKTSLDVCVFTVTDNRLSERLLTAHRRGVAVRILTDNDKSEDRGSDVDKLREQGIAVRMDRSEHHMHHKFALFDSARVVTGSYNWTRSAAKYNRENILITNDEASVRAFAHEFEALWKQFA